jgi:hypothetical protein
MIDPPGHVPGQTQNHQQTFGSSEVNTNTSTCRYPNLEPRRDPTDGKDDTNTGIPQKITTSTDDNHELDSIGTIGFMSANVSEIVHHHKLMTANGFIRCAKRPPQEPPTRHTTNDTEYDSLTRNANTTMQEPTNIKKTVRFDTNTTSDDESDLFSEKTRWGTFAFAQLVQEDQPELVHLLIPNDKRNDYDAYLSSFDRTNNSTKPKHNPNPAYLAIDKDVISCADDIDTILATAKDRKTKDKKEHFLLEN